MFISIFQMYKVNSFAAVLGIVLLHFLGVLLIQEKPIISEVVCFLLYSDFILVSCIFKASHKAGCEALISLGFMVLECWLPNADNFSNAL